MKLIALLGCASVLTLPLTGCSVNSSQGEQVSATSQAVTDPNLVLGFEQPTSTWSATGLNLQQGDQHTAGSHSAEFIVTSTSGSGRLTSVPLSSLGKVASVVTAQLWLPGYLAGQSWQGQVALHLNSPMLGIYDQYIGPTNFQNAPTGSFHALSFALPASVVNALSTGVYDDLTISLEFDFPANPNAKVGLSDPFYIDALDFGLAGSSSGSGGTVSGSSGTLSSTNLTLLVSKNACTDNGAQDFFQVQNSDSAPVKLSDITIKYWINDTTGNGVVPNVWYGGCVTDAAGGCTHPVANVTATATALTSCGSDPNQQANWEVTVSTTDQTPLSPGSAWSHIQTAVNLANYANFSPGSSTWFSSCGNAQPFAADPHFGVYTNGKLVSVNGISAPACRAPHGLQQLTGYVSPAIAAAPIVGTIPQSETMNLAISLPLQAKNAAGQSIDDFIQQVSDPNSAQYRQYLTPDTFAAMFGPKPADYQALTTWVGSVGLSVLRSYSNNSLLYVSGTVGAIENALFANLVLRQRPDGSQFFSLDREPSLGFPIPVLTISGLNSLVIPTPALASAADCPNPPAGEPAESSVPYAGADFRRLYASCTALDGGGAFPQSVGLLELDDFSQSDITLYEQSNGIPVGTVGNVRIPIGKTVEHIVNGPEEVALDIEMVASMAPGASIIVFGQTLPHGFGTGYTNTMFAEMASDEPISRVLSSSWQFDIDDETSQLVAQFAAQGQTLFQSSGDNGAYFKKGSESGDEDPLDNRRIPYTTLVGGTIAYTTGVHGQYQSEIAWPDSGGGDFPGHDPFAGIDETSHVPLPAYQSGLDFSSFFGSPFSRNSPDVSMVASNIQIVRAGKFLVECGTSVAAPLWAGFGALINQETEASGFGPVGFLNPVLYGIGKNPAVYETSFNDITSGNNGFPAVKGYDDVTGLGTPMCALINQLASQTPTVPLNTNKPPPACSSVQVSLSGNAAQLSAFGPIICGNGTGFTPGGSVEIEYVGIPSGEAAQRTRVAIADANGTIKFTDLSQENAEDPVPCTHDQELLDVKVNIYDDASGCVFSTSVQSDFWCPNGALAEFGNGCPG